VAELRDEVLREEVARARVARHPAALRAELDADALRRGKRHGDSGRVPERDAVPRRVADPVRVLEAQLPRLEPQPVAYPREVRLRRERDRRDAETRSEEHT